MHQFPEIIELRHLRYQDTREVKNRCHNNFKRRQIAPDFFRTSERNKSKILDPTFSFQSSLVKGKQCYILWKKKVIRIYRHLKLPLFVCFCHDKTLLVFLFSGKQTEYTKKRFKSTSVSMSPDNTGTCQTTPHFAVEISFGVLLKRLRILKNVSQV